MLGKDGQQKGTDLREKRKTRLPFSPSPFWKPFNGNTQSPRSGSFIFKMAAMLQIPRVFPRVSCRGSAKAVQCPCPGPKIGDKSQQIPRYSPVCPRGHPPGMAADKCIMKTARNNHRWPPPLSFTISQLVPSLSRVSKFNMVSSCLLSRFFNFLSVKFAREGI